MEVLALKRIAARSADTQPLGIPDPAAVEWLRAAMSAGPHSPENSAAISAPYAERVQGARSASRSGLSLGDRILTSMRSNAEEISTDWQKTDALVNDLRQRSTMDGGLIQGLFELQKSNVKSYIKLDILSKTVGKTVYSIDTLARA